MIAEPRPEGRPGQVCTQGPKAEDGGADDVWMDGLWMDDGWMYGLRMDGCMDDG